MKYADARKEIKSGDVLAWTHNGIKSWADFEVFFVRLFQRSEYSHVGVAWVIGGRVFVLEAVGSGVRIFPLSMALHFYWIPIGVWSDVMETFAMAQVGASYSKWEAIRGFFGATRKDDKWQCAEYTRMILEFGGIELECDTTPSGVVEALLNKDFSLKVVTA